MDRDPKGGGNEYFKLVAGSGQSLCDKEDGCLALENDMVI